MKIFDRNNIEEFNSKNICISVGTFDGVHKGHKKIIEFLLNKSRQLGSESAILTLWPHPKVILNPKETPQYLNTLNERIELLKKTNIDNLIIYPFTKELSNLKYNEFVKDILISKFNVTALVVGFNNRIGNKGEGQSVKLFQFANELNIKVFEAEPLSVKNVNISSTKIRNALENGEIDLANNYLSYNYFLRGTVVEGQQMGRTIGFNTANVKVEKDKLIPKNGVYAVRVNFQNATFSGMLNIGFRPTIDKLNNQKTIEVHIFGFNQNLYGKTIEIQFIGRIRDEIKFENINALKQQLDSDKKAVMTIL